MQETSFAGTARFEIRRALGAGGMGVVYEAWDRERNEAVALKTLRDLSAAAIYRLKQEFRALADVAHPNLVALHELITDGDRWFFTMELVPGVDFLSWVRPGHCVTMERSSTMADRADAPASAPGLADQAAPVGGGPGVLEEERLRMALRQLCEAVAAVHEGDRLHRDLKPSNVLVQPDGRVVVLDFGLALDLHEPSSERSMEPGVAGTPSYMSPEQAAMEPVGEAADWYAVGVMLYEALTGRSPFTGKPLQILIEKQRRAPVGTRELAPAAPADLCSLCDDLLRREPDRRPDGAEIQRRIGRGARGAGARATPSIGKLPLVGQESVLLALDQAFREVRQGRSATVLLEGSAGVGTTTVARQFSETVEVGAGAVVLYGRCHERESVPFKGLDGIVDALSRFLRRLPRPEAEVLLPRDVRALVRMFPVLRRVDTVARAPQQTSDVPDPQELRKRGVMALRELLGRITDRRPLVLIIDGLQWSDPDSTALLPELLRTPNAPAMLLVGCYRRSLETDVTSSVATTFPRLVEVLPQPLSELRAKLAAVCDLREVEVGPLSPSESRDLSSRLLLQASLPASLADAVAKESAGSPFLIHELVRALHIGGSVRAVAGELTFARALEARLDQLPHLARALLEAIAVSGSPTLPAVAAHAAEEPGDTRAALSLLRAGHLLRTSADGERLEIYHDRIREAVLDAIPASRKRELHLKVATSLVAGAAEPDPAALAHHYQAAGNESRAAEYAALAGERAAEALAFDRAARLFRLALTLRSPDAEWGRDLEAQEAHALAASGLGARSAEAYLRAAARPWTTRAEAIELRRRAAEQYLRSGHVDEGLEVLRAVLAAHGMRMASTPRRALVSLVLWRARVRMRGTRFEARDGSQISAEDLARIDVCWAGAVGLGMVDIIRGSAFQAQHLLLALRAGEPVRVARALAAEAPFVATSGGIRAQRVANRLVSQSRELGTRLANPQIKALAGFAAAIVDFLAGRWRLCLTQADEAAVLFRTQCTGVAWELSNCHLFSLWSLFYLGRLGELKDRVEQLRREAVSRGDLYAATSFRTGLTNVALLVEDDVAGARREVDQVLTQWSQQAFHFQHYFCLLAQGVTDLYAGDGKAAYERIERLWPTLERTLMLRIQNVMTEATHLRARSALAALDGSPADAAHLAAAKRDAAKLARVPLPWSQALGLLVHAGVAAASGAAPAATELFQRAADELSNLDMTLFAAAARRRIGELRGPSGADLIAEADSQMSSQGIANPQRMAALLAPGG